MESVRRMPYAEYNRDYDANEKRLMIENLTELVRLGCITRQTNLVLQNTARMSDPETVEFKSLVSRINIV